MSFTPFLYCDKYVDGLASSLLPSLTLVGPVKRSVVAVCKLLEEW